MIGKRIVRNLLEELPGFQIYIVPVNSIKFGFNVIWTPP
jgi:hypothetical protein